MQTIFEIRPCMHDEGREVYDIFMPDQNIPRSLEKPVGSIMKKEEHLIKIRIIEDRLNIPETIALLNEVVQIFGEGIKLDMYD